MININQKTPKEINKDIANSLVKIRKRKKISQTVLSKKSGVSVGSIRRFEQENKISIISLTKIAIALGISEELENLFKSVPFDSIEEILNEQSE